MQKSNAKRKASGAARDCYLRKTYGISGQDYDRLLAEQGNACKLCGWKRGPKHRRLAVDHDHETGKVRGLLCQVCNGSIGVLENVGLEKVQAYLAR